MDSSQEQLTPEQHRNLKRAVKLLENGRLTFDFRKHPHCELLSDALLLLCDVVKYGTTDGKPRAKPASKSKRVAEPVKS